MDRGLRGVAAGEVGGVEWLAAAVGCMVLGFLAFRLDGRIRPAPMAVWMEGVFLNNPLRRVLFGPAMPRRLLGTLDGVMLGEVGVGVGFLTVNLAPALGPSGRLLGIDRQAAAVRRARRTIEALPSALQAHVELAVADARALPWASASLDRVLMVAVLGELPSAARPEALREARRVLRASGRLVVVEYWPDPHYIGHDNLRRLLRTQGFEIVDRVSGVLQHGVAAVPHDPAAPEADGPPSGS